jgi:hypothetical protein
MNVRAPIARALRRAADWFQEDEPESDGRPDGYVTDISAESPCLEEIPPGPRPIGGEGTLYL